MIHCLEIFETKQNIYIYSKLVIIGKLEPLSKIIRSSAIIRVI